MMSALLPMSALLRRELLRHVRRVRVFLAVAALLCICGWVIWSYWPDAPIPVLEVAAERGGLTTTLLAVLLAASFVIVPGYAAMAIRAERDNDTYELMRLTLLTPLSILLGTLLNITGMFAIGLVAALPFLYTTHWMGGLPWHYLPIRLGIILSSTVTAASIGVLASTQRQKTSDAVGSAFIYTMLLQLGVLTLPLRLIALLVDEYTQLQGVADALRTTALHSSPIWAIGMRTGLGSSLICIASQVVFSAVILFIAWKRLGDFEFKTAKNKSVQSWFAPSELRAKYRRAHTYPDGKNPVFVREFHDAMQRAQVDVTSSLFAVLFTASAFVVAFVRMWVLAKSKSGPYGLDELTYYFMGCIFLGGILIPGLSTPTWISERNTEAEESLEMSLLTRRERFWGRASAAAALPVIVITCCLVGASPVLMAVPRIPGGYVGALAGYFAVVATVVVLLAVGRVIARLPISAVSAVALAYVVSIAYMGLPVLAAGWSQENSRDVMGNFVASISPITGFLRVLQSRAMGVWYDGPVFKCAVFIMVQSVITAALLWTDLKAERKLRNR